MDRSGRMWWIAAARAGEVDGGDGADLAEVAAAAVAGVVHPADCARMVGDADQVAHVGPFVGSGSYRWRSALGGGAWSAWALAPSSEVRSGVSLSFDAGDQTFPFVPTLFGAFPETPEVESGEVGEVGEEDADFSGEPRRLLVELLDVVRTPVEVESLEPAEEPGMIRYLRSLSSRWTLFGRHENRVEVWLDAATRTPRRWHVQLEDPVSLGRGEGRIVRMDLVLEVDAEGRPTRDALDATGGFGLLTMRVARTIGFRCED